VSEIKHRMVETNGIHMHIAESGPGPLVVLCHGFPESWCSWRHQLHALGEAGFRAIAPDMRGYEQTNRPEQLDRYRASEAPPAFAIHSYPVEKRCPVSCNLKECMSGVLSQAQESFEKSLAKITLADLIGQIRAKGR
jgi:hypothetical protein